MGHDGTLDTALLLSHPCLTLGNVQTGDLRALGLCRPIQTLSRVLRNSFRTLKTAGMCEHAAFAVRKCPFLSQLAREHGEEYATSIALAPTKPVGAEPLPSGTDAVVALASNFRLFHGPQGVVPLASMCPHLRSSSGSRPGCPHAAQQAAGGPLLQQGSRSTVARKPASTRPVAPFATISLSGPNFGDFLGKHFNKANSNINNKKPQRPHSQQQRPQRAGPAGNNAGKPPHGPAGSSSTGSSGALGGGSNLKPQRPVGDPTVGPSTGSRGFSSASSAAGGISPGPTLGSSSSTPTGWSSTGSSSGTVRGPSPFQQQRLGSSGSSSSGSSTHSGSGADSKGGGGRAPTNSSARAAAGGVPGCPLRKWLGPVAGLVFNQYDKLVCPPAIVSARAALAKTAAVQQLRPQALPVKLVAVAAVVAGVNLPCGAVREHFEKFSVGWFIAVHATIPFVAMLRKAVIMPKYAMVVTIAAAVLGQVVGSRMERMRLQHEQQHGPLLPLQLSLPLLQHQEAGAEPPPAGSSKGSSVRGNKRTSAAGAAGRSMAQHADSSSSSGGRGKGWRERLAADLKPAAEGLLGAGGCGSGGGGFAAGGLFARLPLVKA